MLVAILMAVVCAPISFALGSPDPSPAPLPAPAYGSYGWPLRGAVIRPFEEPAGPYGPGHRGLDIAASQGTPVRAAQAGVVAFAGKVAGDRHVSVDHPDGVRTTYSFLGSVAVQVGRRVAKGELIGTAGVGHPGTEASHLHFGARYAGRYIDPMLLLERGSLVGLIHLAPIEEA
jgi:murein DD-endopeptidase MepM/ murein hydrolase activator NlpD